MLAQTSRIYPDTPSQHSKKCRAGSLQPATTVETIGHESKGTKRTVVNYSFLKPWPTTYISLDSPSDTQHTRTAGQMPILAWFPIHRLAMRKPIHSRAVVNDLCLSLSLEGAHISWFLQPQQSPTFRKTSSRILLLSVLANRPCRKFIRKLSRSEIKNSFLHYNTVNVPILANVSTKVAGNSQATPHCKSKTI